MKKRVLSLILALVLCVGLLPVTALAATETKNARETISKLPDDPGRPVLTDVSKTEFWPVDSHWNYPVSREEVFSRIEETTLEVVKGKRSDTEKAKAIFDWVAQNISYDYESAKSALRVEEAENPFHAFYRRTGVCNGYSTLASLMDIIAGLPSVYIIGTDGAVDRANHAWNGVYADGRWIIFDATWKDWDVDPYFYHDVIERVNIYGEFLFSIPGISGELNMLSQKAVGLPKDLVIPSFVDVLEGNAFMFRPELKSVIIHKNVTKVSGVFDDCPNLESITFEGGPDSKLTFFSGVSNCPSLSEIAVPDGVTRIEAFRRCTGLRSVTLPDSVKSMDYSTFAGCTRLQDVRLSNGLEKIPTCAFKDCTSLKSITIPSSVTEIDSGAFSCCPALESVYIPSSVTVISDMGLTVFYESPNVVIYTEPGSYAENYAKEHNIKVVTSGLPTPTPTPDVSATPSAWAQAEVSEAAQAGLVPGDMLSSYTSAINREEFCRLMVRLIEAESGKDIASYVTSQGKEVSAPFMDTSSQQVRAAYTLGIVNGVSKFEFNPSGSITRQEAAAMLERTARLLGLTGGDGVSFADSGSIASWAADSVAFVSGLTDPVSGGKVMGGVGGNSFGPTGTYTREQAIATSLRLFHCAA